MPSDTDPTERFALSGEEVCRGIKRTYSIGFTNGLGLGAAGLACVILPFASLSFKVFLTASVLAGLALMIFLFKALNALAGLRHIENCLDPKPQTRLALTPTSLPPPPTAARPYGKPYEKRRPIIDLRV